jgi:hypothetical protein
VKAAYEARADYAWPREAQLSLLSALASMLLVFTIVRRLATDRAALLAAILVAASMPFWATATTGRFYAPFLASYLLVLHLVARISAFGITTQALLMLTGAAMAGRWLHELMFTVAGVPFLCLLVAPKMDRRKWLLATAAVVAGLLAAQAALFGLHALEPASGETMVRRFFLWQVLNLFEVPGDRQYGLVLTLMVVAWVLAPARAALIGVTALCGTAMVVAFSLARASNIGPLDAAAIATVLSEGARYPLDMFRYLLAAYPVTALVAIASLVARLAGAGGAWRPHERAAHLLWLFWVLWFGVIDSGITMNYLLLPIAFMLAAVAIDLDAIATRWLPPVTPAIRRIALTVFALAAVALGMDQWRGEGSVAARLEAARPTIDIAGIDEVRASIQPADRIACTDELACLLLVGRIDRWLALDDFVRERFLVKRQDGAMAGVYTGAPAVFRPGELFTPNPDGTLPDRVLIVDVFKEFPIGHSAPWLPRAIELDGLQVIPLLETPQGRVLQVSPQERNASR